MNNNDSINYSSINSDNAKSNKWNILSIFSFVISLAPLFMGLNKLTEYCNSKTNPVNVYVGGDAYNYIINANLSTAYFVLFGVLFLAGIGFGIIYFLKQIYNKSN